MHRAAAVLLLAGASVLALAPVADAHALLSSSEPASGAELQTPPDDVTIVFTETPEQSLSSIHVLDASGAPFEHGRPLTVPGDTKALRVRVRPLPQGVYTVAWRVVSREDGHATAGSFAFGVGVAVGANVARPPGVSASPSSPSPSALEMAGRWDFFAGLFGIIGGAWVAAGAFRDPRVAAARVAAWSWTIAVVGLVILAEAQRRAGGSGIGDLLSTRLGHALLWRAAGLVAAGLALLVAAHSPERRRRLLLWIAAAAAAGAAYAHVAAGHASASSPKWAEILAQWVHVIAASVWVGGLVGLLVAIGGAPSEEKAAGVRRFSTVAAFGFALVLGTGVVRAFGELPRWSALWSTSYGVVVIVKSGMVLVLAALGAVNRYGNVPRAAATLGGLRSVSRGEVAVGAAAVVAASLLASLAPPAPSARATAPAGIVVAGADFGTTIRVRLSATPGTAGNNRFELIVTDYDTGKPVRATRVSLRFRYVDDPAVGESTLTLKRDGDVYTGSGLTLSPAGRYNISVLIERGTASQEIALQLATRCLTTVTPGDPPLYDIAFGAAGKAQGYVDPRRAGPNEVHVTFFTPSGDEQPISGTVTMRGSSGDRSQTFVVRRLGPGHFVADADLAAGVWRFDFSAVGDKGAALRGCFTDTVRA